MFVVAICNNLMLTDPMIAGQVSKPLLSVRSEMSAELRGEDKAATSDSELNEPLLVPVESNDSEDTPSRLFDLKFGG
ncbi:POU domain; class 6; transcription factor 2 [Camelus dromedarius]|uniref:POU domain n=1 Tax=Camelus dromedarius TaxID=9838 RepID=A0A5N4DXQ5_CAMDR|nr:POU domain; class 6; transcription factor 2 [Camelus dromedarius]